jgi:hypothetical protein
MRIDFCDWEPCPWLKKVVEMLALQPPQLSQASVTLVVISGKTNGHRRNSPQGPVGLSLWYCPFCGVRIHDNKDILAWISQRLRS